MRLLAARSVHSRYRTIGILLTTSALVTATALAVAAPAALATPSGAPVTASDQAQATGQPVEVTELTTPTSQVMAEPDGTFTLTSNREPVRVSRGGQWIPIDTTLARNGDGSYSPRATEVELTFSGGGSDPALIIGDPGSDGSISISWTAPLPVPVITGDTATYPAVLPGVDLVLTAKGSSYSETLVVHDAEAAANPELQNLRVLFQAHHLDFAEGAAGGLSATDGDGDPVFVGAEATVWDSSFDPRYGARPAAGDPGGASTTPIPASIPELDGSAGTASATAILRTPRDALLGPDVQYPVFIDPVLSLANPGHFLVVSNGTTSLHSYDTGTDLKVGKCDWGAICNNIGVARSFFTFDITALTGQYSWQDTTAQVFDAEVDAYQVHNGAGCTAEPVTLYTTSAFSSSTVWPGPAFGTNLGSVSAGYSDSCGTGTGGYDKFTSSAIAGRLEYAATLGSVITFGLHAPDETDRDQWKRFDTNPQLVAHFSYAPSRLTATGVTGAVSCNGQLYAKNQYPVLTGTAHDNNYPHYPLTMRFSLYNDGGTTLLGYADRDTTDNAATSWTDTYPTVNGTRYEYGVNARVKITDPDDPSMQWAVASSHLSFIAAYTPPATAVSVGSSDYPENNWGITAAQPGSFALRDDDSAVVGFTYRFDGGAGSEPTPTSCTTAGATTASGWVMDAQGQATITAPASLSTGRHVLYVKAFNGALLPSSTAESAYAFYVSPGTGTTLSNRAEAEDGARVSYPATSVIAGASVSNASSSTILDLKRWLVGGTDRLTTAGPATPSNGALQSGLGLVYAGAAMPGTSALYDCLTGSDHFTSADPACEGKTRTSTSALGYLYASQPTAAGSPSTHALYRCRTSTGDHFDSRSSTCEGGSNLTDGTLGYDLDGISDLSSPRLSSLSSADGARYVATNSVGSQFAVTFTVPVEADYAVGVELITGPNNGRTSFSIAPSNNLSAAVPLGENGGTAAVDGYSTAMAQRYVLLGGPHLSTGSYTLIGSVAAAGSAGGYGSEFDYFLLAPINNLSAVPNSVGITKDGVASSAALEGGGTLSQTALQNAGYVPGQPFSAAGVLFTPFGRDAAGNDNIAAASNTYVLPSQVPAGAEVDLLVLAAGGATPNNSPAYQLSMNYGDPTDLNSPYTNSSLPAVPNWRSSLVSGSAASADGVVTREPALTLHQYNNGATSVQADVQLYVLKVKITPTAAYPLTSITLPASSAGVSGQGQLHVLAITTH